MQHPGSAQNLSRQSSHQSLSPPYSRDQQQFALGRHQGQPSPYLSRHEGRGDRSHAQYNQDSQNAPQRGNMVKIDNVTSDRRRRNPDRDTEQSMRRRMDSQPVPHFEPPINQSNQYYPSGDDRQNLSYDSRVSADQSRYNLPEDPRLARHESQRSVNYPGHQNPNVSRHESQRSLANSGQPDTHVSRHESQRSLANVGHPDMPVSHHESQRSLANKGQPDMPVSRHESQRSLNYTQQPYNQSNAFSGPLSHQPAESPYVSRRRDPNSMDGSQSLQRQSNFPTNVSNLQNQPVSMAPTTRDMHPPSRQPPSPYMSQNQRSRSQQDVPPSPYMSRHQAPESPYLSRNASQRSVPHNIPSQSVSRHESQKSISSPNHPISSPDMQGYQPSSSNSTLTRYASHQLYGDEPSATSTLLRQSHDRQSREQPTSATSTLTRGMSNSHQNQAQVHASQTSLNQRPLYTRQNSEPPPPYQTFDRQHSRGEEKHFQDQDLHQQSVHEDRQVSRSQSQLSRQPDQRMTPKLSRYESERSVARTQQSGYSQHSRASSLSNSHPIPDVRGLEASSIIDILQKEFVILTGGRDRQGGPVITFPPNRHIQPNFTAEDIAICLKYFAQIPSEESKRRGITVVIDSRDGSWSNLVTVLGCLKESLGESLKQVLVIKPDNAADRRSSSNSFRRDRDRPNIEPQFISVSRLYTFVDRNQLTGQFSGTLPYHHEVWLQNRLDLEKFIRETRAASNHLEGVEYQIHQRQREPTSPIESVRQHKHLQQEILNVPSKVIADGRELLNRLHHYDNTILPGDEEPVSTLDHLEAQKQVKRLIQYIENLVDKLQNLLEDQDRSLITNQKFDDLQKQIKGILNWILGPGEKLLASQTDIGDSFETANELRKRQEELEIKCTDTYGQYAELRHKADELIAEDPTGSEDVRSTRDYMDTVFRSFASRLERRRNLLITSVRFHRLSEEFSKKLDDLLELVCSEPDCLDVSSAEKELKVLEEKCEAINNAAESSLGDGQSLLDEMSRPIKNASGKDITPDYARHIKHVSGLLEELQERKMRCDELADVRKLKLQQILQLCTCEQDAEQAIAWILELCEVMANTHTNMGKTHEEADKLKEDHKKFESTAQSTYEYGKQLLQAALVLRRSLRHDLEPNKDMTQRLEEAWWKFSQGTNERANRLTVSAMFLASVEKILDNIEKILLAISQTLTREVVVHEVLQKFTPLKNQVDEDYKDTVHMGKALLERLAFPLLQQEGDNRKMGPEEQGATATINSKLRKLEHKKLDMDRYWGEMEYTKRPPQVEQIFSPKRQRTIPTIPNRTNTAFDENDKSIYEEPVTSHQNRTWNSEMDVRPANFQKQFNVRPVNERVSRKPASQVQSSSQNLHYAEIGAPSNVPAPPVRNRVRRTRQGQLQTSAPNLHYAEIGPSSDADNTYGAPPKNDVRGPPDHLQSNVPNLHYAEMAAPSEASSTYGAPLMRDSRDYQSQVQASAPNLHYAEIGPYGDYQQRPHDSYGDQLKTQIEEGAEWIRVRVHQMEPDLMEVGSTLEEALQYRQEHHEMLNKLKAKEQEIKNILTSADQYAAENSSQAEVYAAMADTLGEAWKELNNKLEYRGVLLDDSVQFHQSAADFSSKMEQAQSKFSSTYPTQDVNTARRLLQQHQDIKRSILESSKTTHDIGHSLVRRIQEMGMHADLQNRHATTAACYGIELVLELLQDRRRRLEELWEQRRIQLEQCLQLCQLDQEVNKVLDWYRQTGNVYLQNTDLGDCHQRSRIIQQEHYRFETQAKEVQETVLRLVRTADQLLRRSNLDVEGVRQRLQTVDTECENFMVKLDTRRKNINMATSFFEQTESALTRLDQVEVQLNTMDLPRNSAELADRHSQLSNAIMEISTPPLRDGRILLERVSRDDRGADGIRRLLAQLQDRCTRLESLCKARRAEAWERSQAYLHFQEKYTSLQTWLLQIGQATLSRHADLGTRLETAEDFLEIHEQLDLDIRDKNAELEALFEAGVNLVKSGDQEAQNAAEKVDTLHQQMQRIHRVIEFRIQLSLVYLSFHKKVQQFQNNAGGLEHILKSEKEHLQDLTETAIRHTEELWTITSQQFHEVDDKGREFLNKTSTINDDASLNIKQAVFTVEKILSESRETMTTLTTTWESWQQKVSSSRQFKSQWHQFIQDARKSIDNCMKLEKDFFFPNLAGYLGNSSATAEEMQRKCQEFEPLYKRGLEELENHMTTGEMLLMKGDTRGQLDQIMNELTKVYHRFKARIHEYHILVKMTIQFFRNLDQLDKLIEKTEQQYSQSNLPTDLSQAEHMLEDHKRKKQEVSSLINYTADEGEKIVVRVRQTDAEAAAQEDVERVLNVTAEYKQRWNQAWEDQEKRLKQNLQICQFNYDLRQIHSEIDELHHHLQARRGSYGNSLPASRMTSQAFKQFEMTVELIEQKINKFTSTAELMVQDRHYDSAHIGREIDMLNTKWSTFHTSVRDYRKMLDTSVEYYHNVEETEQWMKDGNNLLIDIGRRINQCKSPQEVDDLVKPMEHFLVEGKPKQEERLRKISELAVELYGNEGPNRVHDLFAQNEDLMQSLQQASNQVSNIKRNLQEREVGPPVAEQQIQPMEVMVTASAQRSPPKILKHLQNAEVVEGEKFTFECHVDSPIQPEVTWFKDNLPLNSPDYETRYNNGIATLTIEETFSEDTARYTVRFTTTAGSADSSAHLTVREMHQQIVPPDFTKNLKSVDVLEDAPFAFECHVTGIPSPTISWYKDEMNIDSSPEYVITKINGTCCLKIRKIGRHHSARYTCKAVNPGGESASSARLNVVPLDRPVIHQMTNDISIPEGKGFRIEVIFSGSPTPEVAWFRDQDRVIPSSVYKISIEVNRTTLEISEAYPEDSGAYTAILQNAAGETQQTCQVTVESFYSSAAEDMSQASAENEPMAPSFTQKLAAAREAMEGSRVRLDCVLVGHPEPEVVWFHNDKPVKESKDIQLLFEGDRCTLSIREAYLEDAGVYRCEARNPYGSDTTVSKLHVEPLSEMSDASVNEATPPKFTQLLRDLNVQSGHRVCLQCRVNGHPIPDVQWFKDGKPIDMGPDYQVTAFADVHNLTIPEAFVEDSGTYMVKAVNMVGEAKSYAKLSVKTTPEPMETSEVMKMRQIIQTKESQEKSLVKKEMEQSPPEFQRLFHDMTVTAGEPVSIECSISGSPKPKVTWYFNGMPIVSRDYVIKMEGLRHTLYIPETFDEDAGRFSITAENPLGKATCSAYLFVEEEPTIPKTRIIDNSEMSRRVSHTETVSSTETRISRVIETRHTEPTYIPSSEEHSTTIITDVKPQYEIRPIESREKHSTTLKTDIKPQFQPVDLTIAVPVPPKFVKALKNIETMEGTRVTFEGVVTGKPEPKIKWFRQGKELTDKADFEISYKDGRVSLSIPEAFPEDQGQFKCTAKNVAGQATSSAELIVRATMVPPSFIQKPQSQNVKEGKPVRFTVRVAGQPPPEITWYKDGSKIVSSPDFELVQEGDVHSLYIPEVFYEDGGQYTVEARNPAGQTQCTANLRVEVPMEESVPDKPPPVFEERFEPKRAPPARAAPEEPSPKARKLQLPSEFVKKTESPREVSPRYQEEVKMEISRKPEYPTYEQTFRLPTGEQAAPMVSKQKPRFTQPLQNKNVNQGEPVVFEARVEAHPEPIIKWYRDDVIIRSSPDYQITCDNGLCRLAIAETFPEDSGVFKVVASNANGSDISQATLQVQRSPIMSPVSEAFQADKAPTREERIPSPIEPEAPCFVQRPQNQKLKEGTNAIFECTLTGKPFPDVSWRKRGFPIRVSQRYRITIDETSGKVSLTIVNCKPDDAGQYTCTAVNMMGQTDTTASLIPPEEKIPPPPPAPKTWQPQQQQQPLKPWQQQPEMTQQPTRPWQQQPEVIQQPVKPWQQPQEMAQPPRRRSDFVVPRSEKILESNIQYRLSQEREIPPTVTSTLEFRPAGFEQSLMQKQYYKDGRIKFSSETETSEYESDATVDRLQPSQPTPPKIVQPLKDFRLMEGSDATFVCRITGRPRPKVAWYKNGQRIKRTSRFEMKYTKDGYCTLRVRMALLEDAGHYTVLAVNSSGKDTCSSELYVDSAGNIDSTSFVGKEALDKILGVDKEKEIVPEEEGGIMEALSRPMFKKVPEDREVREGNTVRFDTLVSGRPAPELAWFRDNVQVHNDDQHKIVVNEDGVNSLIILAANRNDSGHYTCLAKNKAGENSFTVELKILEKEQMQPPRFVERIQNFNIREGQPVTLRCQVIGIPQPMISWQKEGRMLVPYKPYRIETEGGRSTLTIDAVQAEDSAWFQCSAANVAGTASTRGKLTVKPEARQPEPKKKITIQKKKVSPVKEVPEPAPKPVVLRPTPKPQQITPRTESPPHYDIQKEGFVQQISYSTERASGTLRLVPDEEARRMLSDTEEPMDVAQVQPYAEQPQKIPPRVPPPTPATMSAESSPIPKRRRLGPQTPVEKVPPTWAPRPQAPPPRPEQPMEVEEEEVLPQSVADAKKMFETPEEGMPPARVEPVYKPQPPVPPKHKMPQQKPSKKRVKPPSPPSYEIEREGPVQEISYASETESGYLRLVSEDELDKAVHKVPEKKPVKKRVKLPSPPSYEIEKEGPVQQISYASDTESGYLRLVSEDELDRPRQIDLERTLPQGTDEESHYEIQERGPVQEIHYVSDTEAGTLRLVHSTDDESSRYDDLRPPYQPQIPYSLQTKYEQFRYNKPLSPREKKRVKKASPPKEDIPRDLDRESAVREFIRREGEKPAEEDLYHKDKKQPPKFKTPLKDLTNLKENDKAHFECKLAPYGDSTMKVEWYKDGEPLHHGHRFKPLYDFGFVVLDIKYVFPEDSGTYTCKATNQYGTDEVSSVVKVKGKRSVISDTQLPGEGAIKLQEMEEHWRSPMVLEEQEMTQPKKKRFPPSIDLKPEPVEVAEGEPAKFMVKVSGYPRPRVTWWVNETQIMAGSRFKVRYDGMLHYMTILKVREYEAGQVRVVTKNSEGEAEASTTLSVVPKDDWRSKLRQAPKGELEIELERRHKIELRPTELQKAFEKPKATEFQLKQIERAAETRVKMRHDKEIRKTEYITIDSQYKQPPQEIPAARAIRPDRPEIQIDIQKAKIIPVMPEQQPDQDKVSETFITLERREPPVFTKPLRPSRITEGKPVVLEVHFKGFPPPIISWYRDNFEIQPSHDFQINTTETVSTLRIPEVFPEDTGMFMVKAYNMYGTVQCKAKLTVVEEEESEKDEPPEFKTLIRDATVMEGEPATFDCQVSGRPKPTVKWQKDGQSIPESPHTKFIEEDENNTFLIYEVKPNDAGQYSCEALNSVGKATCTAKLNVEVPVGPPGTLEAPKPIEAIKAPSVLEAPRNMTVDEGEPATFVSKITGYPAPVVTWYRNNQIVKPSKYFQMESAPDGTHSLNILEAFPEDTGNYRCVARNKAGEVTSSAFLKVHGIESEPEQIQPTSKKLQPPEITKPITNTLAVEGSSARFECQFAGQPQPEIKWLRNGLQVIQDSRNYKIEKNPNSTVLTIRETFPEDSGLITCRLKNAMGTTECSAELYVQETAPQVEETAELVPTDDVTTLEGQDTEVPDKVITSTTEITTLDTTGSDVVTSETEEVSFEIVTTEASETAPEEVAIEETPLPEEKEVPLKATVPEVSETFVEETEVLISEDEKPEEAKPEITHEVLLHPKEELPQFEGAPLQEKKPESIEKEEEGSTLLTGEAPKFTKTLEHFTVVEGKPVRFTCVVTGKPRPQITWILDDQSITDAVTYKTEYHDDGTCILAIDETFKEDEGEYICQAKNPLGTARTKADLILRAEEEKLVEEAEDVTANFQFEEKEDFTTDVQLEEKEDVAAAFQVEEREDFTADFQLDLQEKPKLDTQDIEAEFSLSEDLSEKERLTAEEEKERISDEERRSLSTSVSEEEVEESFTVTEEIPEASEMTIVQEKEETRAPEVVQYLQDVSAQDGGQAKLVCKVTGFPRPTVTWYKEDEIIYPSEEFKVTYEGDECSLLISDVYPEDAGLYKVVAKNETGTAMTTCDLTVLAPEETVEEPEWLAPSFTQKPKFQTVDAGQTVVFEAKIVANPGPQIHWTRNDMPLSNDKKVHIETVQDNHLYHTTIQLTDVLAEDAGTYKVTAENDQGEAQVSVSLLVKKPSGPEQTDFRTELKTEVKFEQDVTGEETSEIGEAEQKDFRDLLKKVEKPSLVAPEFVHTIKSAQVNEGEEAKFVTKVTGQPQPKVTWFHDEKPITTDEIYKILPGEEGESILLLQEAFPEDSGKYTVQAENEAGRAMCSAVLKVITEDELDAGEIEEMPKPQEVEKVELVAEQEAEQLDFRDVLKSKVKFSEDVQQIETTETVRETEQIDFREVLQKKQPEELISPEFVISISDAKVQEGASTKFTVKAEGKPAPEIKWFVNNEPITTDDVYQVIPGEEGESTLVLPEAFPEDSGVYTVKAINEAGEAEATALLTVTELIEEESMKPAERKTTEEVSFDIKPSEEEEAEFTLKVSPEEQQPQDVEVSQTFTADVSDVSEEATIPQFLRDLSDQEVTEGDTVTFIVQVTGSPFPKISWFKDNHLIESDDHYKVEVRGNFASLIVEDVMPDDDAEYKVEATNEAGKTSSVGQLFVNPIGEAPTFVSRIEDKEIEVGSPIVLECQVKGQPKPRVTWLKDGEEVVGDRFIYETTDETARLTILDTIPEDEGEYMVKAVNDKGVASSSAEVLIQLESPKFTETLKDVVAQCFDDAVLECAVEGKPVPKVVWLADESVIEESEKYHIRQEGNRAILEIHDVTMEDSDIIYSCRAENAAGEIVCSANLKTQGILL